MPGIAGIITPDRERRSSAIGSMVKCMMHEPFYTCGTYVSDDLGLALGWVNRPGSFSDCMPVWNDAKYRLLIFHGEHFTDHGTNRASLGVGRSTTDARYFLDAFEDDAETYVKSLNGWFTGILIDLRKAESVLFNDRYGMQRLYYHECDGALYFSSEAKALLKVLPKLKELDMRGVGEVCSFGCVVDNRTLFAGVSLVPPASMWTLVGGRVVSKRKYFAPETWETAPPLRRDEFYGQFKETFLAVLPRYFVADQPIGMSL